MEITEKDVKIISNKFNISEEKILNFLVNEERKEKVSETRNVYLNKKGAKNKIAKEWLNHCSDYKDFEDYFFTVDEKLLDKSFFIKWLQATTSYKERRDIYNCVESEDIKKEFVQKWIKISNSLEDIKEAISHTQKNDSDYKVAIKKYLKFYL